MTVLVWIAVVALGGSGAVLRFLGDRLVGRLPGRTVLPCGTLAVNVTGSLALGLIGGLSAGPDVALLAGTAAVGSYTTFSTWMLETQRLVEERQVRAAVKNLLLGLILGVGAAALGVAIGASV